MHRETHVVNVFAAVSGGGNPAPIVLDADGMSDRQMQDVARTFGLESGFILSTPAGSDGDFGLRFWVPNHEMEMCGHATIGAAWLLDRLGRLTKNKVSISTSSGSVYARIIDIDDKRRVEITQPLGRVEPVPADEAIETEIRSVLGITSEALAPLPIQNVCTSRVKTVIPLKSTAILNSLEPDFGRVETLCEQIGSTGLYPYAPSDLVHQVFDARQFPKSSGYPEDAATGIAATALAFGLLSNNLVQPSDRPIRIRQGRAMGRPSEIFIRFSTTSTGRVDGCWLGGNAQLADISKVRGA